MTDRRESMPRLSATDVRWDAEAGRARYFACFDETDEWTEIPAEDFDRLTRLFAQEAVDFACDMIATTVERVSGVMDEFAIFRKTVEEMYVHQYPRRDEGKGN